MSCDSAITSALKYEYVEDSPFTHDDLMRWQTEARMAAGIPSDDDDAQDSFRTFARSR
jgi:hypothetical protein